MGMFRQLGLVFTFGIAVSIATGPVAWAQSSDLAPRGAIRVIPPSDQSDDEFVGPGQPAQSRITAADVAALRYYLRTGQRERYQSELERLRRIDPTWVPPANLATDEPLVDEGPIWELIGAGDYAGAQSLIVQFRQENPGWEPSADLRQQLALGQERQRLVVASDAEQWPTVITIAERNPDLLSCAAVDNMWRTAEAYAQSGQPARAYAIYQQILQTCDDADVRFSTLLKANEFFSTAEVQQLVAIENRRSHSQQEQAEFARIRRELDLGRFTEAVSTQRTLSEGELQQFQTEARSERSVAKANLIGWYYFNRGRFSESRQWFTQALSYQRNAESARGLAESELRLGNVDRAEAVASEWIGQSSSLREIYANIALQRLSDPEQTIDADRLVRYESFATTYRNGPVSTLLGWHYYNLGDFETAVVWFDRSLAAQPDGNAAEGLALAYLQLGDQAQFDQTIATWSPRFPAIAQLQQGSGAVGPLGTAASLGNYGECVRLAARMRGTSSYNAATALQEGWCLMALNRPTEARMMFQEARSRASANDVQIQTDATNGETIALLSLEQPGQATNVIARSNLPDDMRRELLTRSLARQAYIAYERSQYQRALDLITQHEYLAPTDRSVALLKGWSLFQIGRTRQALEVFTALDTEFSTEDTRTALGIVRERLERPRSSSG